jgi:HEPN domain-containing protein
MQVNPREVEIWYRIAVEELRIAKYVHVGGFYGDAVYHCQQSLEKALKSLYLAERDEVFPFTHALLKLATSTSFPNDDPDFLRELGAAYTGTRYPPLAMVTPSAMYDESYSRETLEKTEAYLTWILNRLQQMTFLLSWPD